MWNNGQVIYNKLTKQPVVFVGMDDDFKLFFTDGESLFELGNLKENTRIFKYVEPEDPNITINAGRMAFLGPIETKEEYNKTAKKAIQDMKDKLLEGTTIIGETW